MKKWIAMLMLAVMALSLTACGNTAGKPEETPFTADLTAFYDTLFQGEDAPMMMEITEDMWEFTYPGLADVELKQCVLYTAAISAVAAEVAMVEVADAKDVETVKDIFQARIDAQVGTDDAPGGAWYPATIESWKNNSEIVVKDNYVCLFVSEGKDEIISAFNALGQE